MIQFPHPSLMCAQMIGTFMGILIAVGVVLLLRARASREPTSKKKFERAYRITREELRTVDQALEDYLEGYDVEA